MSDNEDFVLVGKYIRAAGNSLCEGNHYKGLRIHALEGLHEFITDKIQRYFKPQGFVLDLGAGTGALSLRLSELGFHVTAADIVCENFRLHDVIPFVQVNLNDFFSGYFDGQFDGIVAAEIIEHLENPRKFLRECYKLMRPGGAAVLTTPNIDNPVSRACFMRLGAFQWYFDSDYESEGHITPISQFLLKRCISEAGFHLGWLGSFGDPFELTKKWWRMRVLAEFVQMISKSPADLNGEILVAVFRKSDQKA